MSKISFNENDNNLDQKLYLLIWKCSRWNENLDDRNMPMSWILTVKKNYKFILAIAHYALPKYIKNFLQNLQEGVMFKREMILIMPNLIFFFFKFH